MEECRIKTPPPPRVLGGTSRKSGTGSPLKRRRKLYYYISTIFPSFLKEGCPDTLCRDWVVKVTVKL